MIFRAPFLLLFRFLFLLSPVSLIPTSVWAQLCDSPCNPNWSACIDNLINRTDPNVNIGIAIYSLTNGSWLYERNADRLFVPASSNKVLVAAAALADMGPTYVFKTSLYIKSLDYNPTTKMEAISDVYLELSGDPTLTTNDVGKMFEALYQKGVRKISGNIFVEYVPRGELSPTPKTWMIEDLDNAYGAPPTPIIIDRNIRIDKMEVMGEKKPQLVAHPMQDPLKNFSDKIIELVKKQGFVFVGTVIYQALPNQDLYLISDHTSKQLQDMLCVAIKDSDNLIADAIYVRLTSRRQAVVNDWIEISKFLKSIIKSHYKVDLSKANVMDGSGISRLNMISPRQLVCVLEAAARKPRVSRFFTATFPQGGMKGTLRYRFTDPKIQPLIRAKTGSMTGESSLVGFARTLQGEVLVFAIMINNFKGSGHVYKRLEESICYAICGLEAPYPR